MSPVKSWADLLNDAGDAGGGYEVLPEGDYDLIVKTAEATMSSTGKQMYKITCEIETGPHANRRVWHQLVLSPDNPVALGIFFRQMNALGLNEGFFKTDPSDHQVAAALQGRRFKGILAIKKYQGQDKNELKNILPAGTGVASAFTPPPPSPAYAAPPPASAPTPPPPPAAPPAPPAPVQAQAEAPVDLPTPPPAPVAPVEPPVTSTAPPPAPF